MGSACACFCSSAFIIFSLNPSFPPSLPPSLPPSHSARAAEALQKGVAALGSELEGGKEGGREGEGRWACLFKLNGDLLTLAALLPEESGVR